MGNVRGSSFLAERNGTAVNSHSLTHSAEWGKVMTFCCLRWRSSACYRTKEKQDGVSTVPYIDVRSSETGLSPSSPSDSSIKQISSPDWNSTDSFSNPIKVEELADYVSSALNSGFLRQQQDLVPIGQIRSWDRALDANVQEKNRYAKLLAYDDTRVVLHENSSGEETDYINANFIDGFYKPKEYIATQGPKENTCTDFWRMVWQEKVTKIIMLTNLVELGKKKCTKYWPSESSILYGNIEVSVEATDLTADYTITTFCLQKDKDDPRHYVRHFHFTSWPDHGVPTYPSVLVSFLKKIKSQHTTDEDGPTVVHCSAGIGRTGAVILLDCMMEMGSKTGFVDPLKYLYRMRQQRINILENPDQYELVHVGLVEALLQEDSVIPCEVYFDKYSHLFERDKEVNAIERQFQLLENYRHRITIGNCRTALAPENINKNRSLEIIPEECHRPFLKTSSLYSSDYINAVFVSGYRQKDSFIVTQFPLEETIVDFWRLIFDHNISIVVSLNDLSEEKPTVPKYWPNGNSDWLVFPDLSVELISETKSDKDLILRSLRLHRSTKKSSITREVAVVQLLGWALDDRVPPSCDKLLKLLDFVSNLQQKYPSKTVTVTCYDGCTASGLFCVLSFMCEKMKLEHEVDAFLAVRNACSTRPSFVNSLEQYSFCYTTALTFLQYFATYANFQ